MNRKPSKSTPVHGHFLGNGGQAIELHSRLFTRDLFEHGIHLSPFVGAVPIDQKFRESIDQIIFPKELALPVDVLAQKLSEIDFWGVQNAGLPLGQILLQALASYSWTPVSFRLPLTNETYDPAPPESEKFTEPWIQVANRLRDRIYIHQPSWESLSAITRTVLLCHEAIYSLLRPLPAQSGSATFRQFGPKARALTAAFFDENTYTNSQRSSKLLAALADLNLERGRGEFSTKNVQVEFFPYVTFAEFEQLALRQRLD